MSNPTFLLFKTSRPTCDGSTYCGHVTLPDGTLYTVEAKVVDHHYPPSEPGKHFEGACYPLSVAAKRMIKGGTVEGDRAALPQQLLDLMEPLPFNDPLPPLEKSA